MLSACVHTDPPAVPEPTLTVSAAEDITRTSASVSVSIDKDPSTKLSYLNLYFGTSPESQAQTLQLNVDAAVSRCILTDLKPGATYFYYAEAGTATAKYRSENGSFTTIPNNPPSVSVPRTLSSGPTGIVVEFEILDDGGEAITSAGCEIQETPISSQDPNPHRFQLASDKLYAGTHQLYITGLNPMTTYNITAFVQNPIGETKSQAIQYTTKSGIDLLEPGILSSLFSGTFTGKSLTISGKMNGSDFKFLRSLPSLETLDLSDADILAGGESYDGSRYTETDIVTTDLFSDCAKLKELILPNSATAVKRNAFARCAALESIYIPLAVTEILPSADCPSLKEIKVSEGNPNFASISGVLFNKDATEILWFPLGKTGEFILPNSIIAIGENAFIGTHITSLVIPNSVKTIKRGAFLGSALEEITLPDNLTNVSEGMFQNCASLKTVRLGAATEFIGNYVFDGTQLTSLYLSAQYPPYVSTDAFVNRSYDLFNNCTLYVPKGTNPLYRNHAKWKQFINIAEISD